MQALTREGAMTSKRLDVLAIVISIVATLFAGAATVFTGLRPAPVESYTVNAVAVIASFLNLLFRNTQHRIDT